MRERSRCALAAMAAIVIITGPQVRTAHANSARGIVKAEAEATISTELVARVKQIPFQPGDTFRAGQPILKFDCRRYLSDLRAAQAEAQSAQMQAELNRKLRKHNAVGAHELALSIVKVEQAEAQMEVLKVRTEQCEVRAPFDGVIVEHLINQHEMPQSNAPLLRIVKSGQLEIALIVPSHWLVWLRPGIKFRFHVEETSSDHQAQVLRVGATVDPVSRTVNIVGLILMPPGHVRPGMSGTATFPLPKR